MKKIINPNLANNWTKLRLFLVIPLTLFIVIRAILTNLESYVGIAAFILFDVLFLLTFILAMISDFIDGKLARKYNIVSSFGKLWDPVADKLITIAALVYICIIFNHLISFLVLFIIICRDIIVGALRIVMNKNNVEIAAIKTGKYKTFFLTIGILTLIFSSIIILACGYKNLYSAPNISLEISFLIIFILSLPNIFACSLSILSAYYYYKMAKKFINKK
ncbi:CDP-diacylglycerol-glycerol-3-phosphate3-phosphatidyltransferase [Mycoplasmopsis meleagridis]|uniref:CDP-diacylglycerol-glycerol-3-phosphate3-phosphatidyltransferase n=1 Tax=Mycoplasmopsis meleagridis ATCC 25294 TaxID=1264554 RepID=A0A0F5H0P4_9BACT|nr:CDP-alcohol phosphatidyltransferase family protein [Mycoplasmopsis meleagridis]KKB26773.1 CDP-diacylglycerol-glycerol-3-phosphate3-phosphatidyltransferase [Mycoplasmopsis meleagridis ATCC 25294]KUH47530.1 hypothetical protein ASB56_00120 [Mycoplasmopsis meleagridis]OAD18111.1 CDP-diacylglycerol-glycerol-3-phosphate3-phosphatidyltransferase [Mycoplasmopsis meleagridis]VEU77307.1 CDP-diacylglycerol--glycerol-3-phosphate 3-phosphatidyltransferase [Mycoplasmopsis meleagridis]